MGQILQGEGLTNASITMQQVMEKV